MTNEKIIEQMAAKLGADDFVSPSKLVKSGIFGSHGAVRCALRKGVLPCLRISSHRTLIHRDSVIELLRKSVSLPG